MDLKTDPAKMSREEIDEQIKALLSLHFMFPTSTEEYLPRYIELCNERDSRGRVFPLPFLEED